MRQVAELARMGWTDERMAKFFDISIRTWYELKAADPKFSQALREWKAEADQRVERSLYELAMGYSHPEDKIFMPAGADEPVIVPTIKHYPPNPTAAIFWLKNRQPAEWRDKREIENTGQIIIQGIDGDDKL